MSRRYVSIETVLGFIRSFAKISSTSIVDG